ncbi:MAG: nicotinate phosphoribosyltransferase [Candidatus Heimdallarchaeaceae archaeon]
MQNWIASFDEITEGKTTDVYFLNAKKCLQADNLDKTEVYAEVTTDKLPKNWSHFLFLGLAEVIAMFQEAKLNVNVYSVDEGRILPPRDVNGIRIPVLSIEGPYGDFAVYETPMLGYLCFQTGVGTSALHVRLAAKEKIILSFGIRRMHPALAPVIDRACYIAGFDGVSCVLSAEKLGIKPTGTIPHAFIIIERGIENAMRSFDKNIKPEVKRIALSDTFSDERFEVMKALDAIGENLYGVRLDTPSSRRGNLREIIKEIKWELKQRGREDIKIFLSGGFDEKMVEEYCDIADGFGVGTSVANSPTVNFALDIVEMNGQSISKRGKYSGRKQVGYCQACDIYLCSLEDQKRAIICPKCGSEMEKVVKQYMKDGKLIRDLGDVGSIRKYVREQMEKLELPKK